MSKTKHKPIRDYISFEDYLEKAGYKQYQPKVNSLWLAILEAGKHQGRSSFLNKMLDVYFRNVRQKKRQKEQLKNEFQKQNSRHNLYSDVANNNKPSITGSIESNGCTTNR